MIEWLVFSLMLLGVWIVIFILNPLFRNNMVWGSILTTPFGLTEPLFVPEYWSPPSLFNLASKTGFDIESFIFCFAIGGIGLALYETFFRVKHIKMSKHEIINKKHKIHFVSLMLPLILFAFLHFLTNLNPIYSASIAMFVGSIGAFLCRPDLKKKIFIGGLIFLVIYFVFFLLFNLIYPGLTLKVWNLSAISGILVLGVPIEEIMFAFTFGMLWSSFYEHIKWYKIKEVKNEK